MSYLPHGSQRGAPVLVCTHPMCHLGLQHFALCVFSALCFTIGQWHPTFYFFTRPNQKQLKAGFRVQGSIIRQQSITNVPRMFLYLIICFSSYSVFCPHPIPCVVLACIIFCTKCALFAPGSHHCAQARETCSITQLRSVGHILGFAEFWSLLP